MALARVLKDMMLFNAANAYKGDAKTVTLPKLTRKLEGYRGAGMGGTAKIDMGLGDDLDLEFTCHSPMRDVLRQFGMLRIDGVGLRFAGAYQNDETGEVDAIEVTVRGRHEEIDMGDAEVGTMGEFKVKSALVYYKLDWNGRTEIEIDLLAGIEIVDGVDLRADIRAAIGV